MTSLQASDASKRFECIGNGFLKEHRVCPKLYRLQRKSSECFDKLIEAVGTLHHVTGVSTENSFTLTPLRLTLELLTWSDLDRRFSCDVSNEKVHSEIFAVEVFVHPCLDVARKRVRVEI